MRKTPKDKECPWRKVLGRPKSDSLQESFGVDVPNEPPPAVTEYNPVLVDLHGIKYLCDALKDNEHPIATYFNFNEFIFVEGTDLRDVFKALKANTFITSVTFPKAMPLSDKLCKVVSKFIAGNSTVSNMYFSDMVFTDDFGALLHGMADNTSVKVLSFKRCDFRRVSVKSLSETLGDHTFDALRFPWCELGEVGLTKFASIFQSGRPVCSVKELDFTGNVITSRISPLKVIVRNATDLETLIIDDNMICPGGAARICQELAKKTALKKLSVCDNDIEDIGGLAIATVISAVPTLAHLSLRGNFIGNVGLASIAESLLAKDNSVSFIDLSKNNIGNAGAKKLARAIKESKLRHVHLAWNNISEEGAEDIGTALERTTAIEVLNLKHNLIGDIGTKCIAAGLLQNDSVTFLDVGWNNVSDISTSSLSQVVTQNEFIRVLKMDHNAFTSEGFSQLLIDLDGNKTLVEVDLSGCHNMSPETIERCRFIGERNACVEKLKSAMEVGDLEAAAQLWELCSPDVIASKVFSESLLKIALAKDNKAGISFIIEHCLLCSLGERKTYGTKLEKATFACVLPSLESTDIRFNNDQLQAVIDGLSNVASKAPLWMMYDKEGYNLLHWVTMNSDTFTPAGSLKLLRFLLKEGQCDPNARESRRGRTPLLCCSQNSSNVLPLVKELVLSGADIGVCDIDGKGIGGYLSKQALTAATSAAGINFKPGAQKRTLEPTQKLTPQAPPAPAQKARRPLSQTMEPVDGQSGHQRTKSSSSVNLFQALKMKIIQNSSGKEETKTERVPVIPETMSNEEEIFARDHETYMSTCPDNCDLIVALCGGIGSVALSGSFMSATSQIIQLVLSSQSERANVDVRMPPWWIRQDGAIKKKVLPPGCFPSVKIRQNFLKKESDEKTKPIVVRLCDLAFLHEDAVRNKPILLVAVLSSDRIGETSPDVWDTQERILEQVMSQSPQSTAMILTLSSRSSMSTVDLLQSNYMSHIPFFDGLYQARFRSYHAYAEIDVTMDARQNFEKFLNLAVEYHMKRTSEDMTHTRALPGATLVPLKSIPEPSCHRTYVKAVFLGHPKTGKTSLIRELTQPKKRSFGKDKSASGNTRSVCDITRYTTATGAKVSFYDVSGDFSFIPANEHLISRHDTLYVLVIDIGSNTLRWDLQLDHWMSYLNQHTYGPGLGSQLLVVFNMADKMPEYEKYLKKGSSKFKEDMLSVEETVRAKMHDKYRNLSNLPCKTYFVSCKNADSVKLFRQSFFDEDVAPLAESPTTKEFLALANFIEDLTEEAYNEKKPLPLFFTFNEFYHDMIEKRKPELAEMFKFRDVGRGKATFDEAYLSMFTSALKFCRSCGLLTLCEDASFRFVLSIFPAAVSRLFSVMFSDGSSLNLLQRDKPSSQIFSASPTDLNAKFDEKSSGVSGNINQLFMVNHRKPSMSFDELCAIFDVINTHCGYAQTQSSFCNMIQFLTSCNLCCVSRDGVLIDKPLYDFLPDTLFVPPAKPSEDEEERKKEEERRRAHEMIASTITIHFPTHLGDVAKYDDLIQYCPRGQPPTDTYATVCTTWECMDCKYVFGPDMYHQIAINHLTPSRPHTCLECGGQNLTQRCREDCEVCKDLIAAQKEMLPTYFKGVAFADEPMHDKPTKCCARVTYAPSSMDPPRNINFDIPKPCKCHVHLNDTAVPKLNLNHSGSGRSEAADAEASCARIMMTKLTVFGSHLSHNSFAALVMNILATQRQYALVQAFKNAVVLRDTFYGNTLIFYLDPVRKADNLKESERSVRASALFANTMFSLRFYSSITITCIGPAPVVAFSNPDILYAFGPSAVQPVCPVCRKPLRDIRDFVANTPLTDTPRSGTLENFDFHLQCKHCQKVGKGRIPALGVHLSDLLPK